MREALDHWEFVFAAYAIGLGGLTMLLGWSWQAMRSAERLRDEVKRR